MRKAKQKVARSRKATRSVGTRKRCIAKTKTGKQCKRFVSGTSRTCSVHRK